MTEKLRNFWTWFTTPTRDYKQFQEYQKHIASRVAGYEAGLRDSLAGPREKDQGPSHSPGYKAGYRDAQRERTPERSTPERSTPERTVRRVDGHDYERERAPSGREAAAAFVRDKFLPDKTEALRAHDVSASGREERSR